MIKNFTEFKESISGTELVGSIGPGYGETGIQNKTISFHDTNIILSELNNKFYTIDEYNEIYNEYLSKNGHPLPSGFNRENLDLVITHLYH